MTSFPVIFLWICSTDIHQSMVQALPKTARTHSLEKNLQKKQRHGLPSVSTSKLFRWPPNFWNRRVLIIELLNV